MQVGETPWSATLLAGYGEQNISPIAWPSATGARVGTAMTGHGGMDLSGHALMNTRWEEMV